MNTVFLNDPIKLRTGVLKEEDIEEFKERAF